MAYVLSPFYAALKLVLVYAVLGCVLMLLAYAALIHSCDGVRGHEVGLGVQQLYITRALNLRAAVGGP